jgi:predicted porin
MKKHILIAAVGAALVAGPIAANAELTAYGKVNTGVAYIDNGNDSNSNVIAVTDDASRLGFKGATDLGGGMKALYQYEITISVDNGGFGGARDVYAGLGGNWGTIRLGQYNTAYKLVSVPTEIFGDTIADFTANGYSGETRQANNIGYTSPNFGGLSFGLEYSTGSENGVSNSNSTPMNASVTWKGGPLYVAAGYYSYDPLSGTNALDSAIKVSAMGKFGGFKVAGTYESQSGQGTVVVKDTLNVAGSFSFGNNEVAATYTMSMAKGEGGAADNDRDCQMIGVGYFYHFSKTTDLNLVYNTISNDSLATCAGRMIGSASVANLANPAAGKNPSGLQGQLSMSF